MNAHPAADLFPVLADNELAELVADINLHGLLHPITVDTSGQVLDGRNRLAACKVAKVKPIFTTYDGDDPIGYVISENLRRRNLTPGQRAQLGSQLKAMYAEEAKAAEAERQRKAIEQQRSKPEANSPQVKNDKSQSKPKRKPQARDKAAKAVVGDGEFPRVGIKGLRSGRLGD